MRHLVILFTLLVCGPVFAEDHHFSDCAGNGGDGTVGDPYCLDPDNDGFDETFGFLIDGADGDDLVAGDTVYLCAGACDGLGTATYNLNCDPDAGTASAVFEPEVNGTAENPITITLYCDGSNCETVILSGDHNNDGIHQPWVTPCDAAEDPFFIIRLIDQSSQYYKWLGDPNGDGVPNMIFERTNAEMFILDNDPTGWTFDGIEMRQIGKDLWGLPEVEVGTVPDCDGTVNEGTAIRMKGLTGTFEVKNSIFHSVCKFVHRNRNNPNAGSMLFENNEYYNVVSVSNDYESRNQIWRNNYLHAFKTGIVIEDRMENVVIEDNLFACLQDFKVQDNVYKCRVAIYITDGNNGASNEGKTKDITIRRNKIYGLSDDANFGRMVSGIAWYADNDTEDINSVIENNMLWRIFAFQNPQNVQADKDSGIKVFANKPVTIQNNTLYQIKGPLTLQNEPGGSSVVHIVKNNIILHPDVSFDPDAEAITVFSGATGSDFQNNNVHYGVTVDDVMDLNGVMIDCADFESDTGFTGSGNKCQDGVIFDTCELSAHCNTVDTDENNWNLHLLIADTIHKDAGTSGPTDDIDKNSRPQGAGTDIGADELLASGNEAAKVEGKAAVSGNAKVQ